MDDIVSVGVCESTASLRQDVQLLTERQGVAANTLLEVLPFQKLHRHVRRALFVVPEVVDGDDVRVLELRRGFRLLFEPLLQIGVGDGGAAHNLDGNFALEGWVEAEIDDAHGAFTQFTANLVFAQGFDWSL